MNSSPLRSISLSISKANFEEQDEKMLSAFLYAMGVVKSSEDLISIKSEKEVMGTNVMGEKLPVIPLTLELRSRQREVEVLRFNG